MRRLILFALSLAPLGGGGCATVKNVCEPEPKPFGGTTMPCYDFLGGGQNAGFAAGVLWPLWLADKPLAFVGDVLTLPYVMWARDHESRRPLPVIALPAPHNDGPPKNLRLPPGEVIQTTGPPGVPPDVTMPSLPAPGVRRKPPDVVGNSVAKAAGIAREQGYSLVVVGTADDVTATVAYTGRRIEARTKDGIVVSAQAFER